MAAGYPSDLAKKFMLRLPADLKARLATAAADAHRSMNAEVLARLNRSLRARPDLPLSYHLELRELDDQLMLRLPEEQKEELTAVADRGGRSLNSELVGRLLDSFEPAAPAGVEEPRPESTDWAPPRGDPLNSDEKSLLQIYRAMTPRRRRALLELLRGH